jgi:desulfoferrodoxin (superoxide reductase-like protein)
MKTNRVLALPIIALPFLPACRDQTGKTEPQVQRYYSTDAPGMWEGQEDAHMPKIEFKEGEKRKFTVTVPLKATLDPLHKIEAIVFLAVDGKKETEIAAVRFTEALPAATAEFEFPPAEFTPRGTVFYVIAKCNLHDMWRLRVEPKGYF